MKARALHFVLAVAVAISVLGAGSRPASAAGVTVVKSDGVVRIDTNRVGVLDPGDTVGFEVRITNSTTQPVVLDFQDSLTTGLASLDILSVPEDVVFNPDPIKTMQFRLDSYMNSGPGSPLPYMTANCTSTDPSFVESGVYAGMLSGVDAETGERYYGCCSELNQNISFSTYNMLLWNSPLSAPLQDGRPAVTGKPISLQQKHMIQGVFHCLGVNNARTITSLGAQDLSIAEGASQLMSPRITNEQAAAAQIACWEIVHEPWNGPSSISLTEGLLRWTVNDGTGYGLPASFVSTFDSIVSCATAYATSTGAQPTLCDTSKKQLMVRGINIQPSATAVIMVTAVVTKDAADGQRLVNVAAVDVDRDGIFDIYAGGSTGPVSNVQTPVESGELCSTGYQISTVVGDGKGGLTGDGGPASQARLYYPMQAAVDTWNNVYIADYSNHVVRCVDARTGVIRTVAGKPNTSGYAGDGGVATNALLSLPSDVWVRGDELYIAEMGNNVIRRVDLLTSQIVTVVGTGTPGYTGDGGPATSATLNKPRSVLVDAAGNIYIADTFNFAIRRVDVCSGLIETIAGTGVAGHANDGDIAVHTTLEWVHDLALRSDGLLYFSEQNGYNLVRRIVNGKIETVCGRQGNSGLGDCGPALDAALNKPYAIAFDTRDNLYIADMLDHRVRVVEATTGLIATLAGTGVAGYNGDGMLGARAQLNNPTGLAVTSNNILYIVDRYNHRLRKLDLQSPAVLQSFPPVASGVIDRIAGTGVAGYNGDGSDATRFQLSYPGGIALDNQGNLIVADRSNHRIRKVLPNGNIVTIAGKLGGRGYAGDGGPAVNATLNFPTDVAIDASGNIYFSDQSNHVVRKISALTGTISRIAGDGTGVAGFAGDAGPAVAAKLNEPEGVAVLGSTLYISDRSNNRVRAVDLGSSGTINTIAGNGTSGLVVDNVAAVASALDSPRGLTVDADGTLYVSSFGQGRVRKISGGIISTVAGSGLSGYAGDGGPAVSAKLNQPCDVCLGPSGTLLVVDSRNNVVRSINAAGTISTIAGTGVAGASGDKGPATAAQLNSPVSVCADGAGHVFISDRLNHAVRMMLLP